MTPLVAEFDTETGKAEIAQDRKLEKILKSLRDGKGEGAPKQLQAMIKGAGTTKVGERASRILKALETPPK